MTCVVGVIDLFKNEIVMGADSCISGGDISTKICEPKIFQRGRYIIGCSGLLAGLEAIRRMEISGSETLEELRLKIISVIKEVPVAATPQSMVLIASPDGLFEMTLTDTSLTMPYQNWAAIGTPRAYALGNLHGSQTDPNAHDRVLRALQACAEYSPLVAPPYDFLTIPLSQNFLSKQGTAAPDPRENQKNFNDKIKERYQPVIRQPVIQNQESEPSDQSFREKVEQSYAIKQHVPF